MNPSFIVKLIQRRLGLPANTTISDIQSGIVKTKLCECGTSHHIACVFDTKKSCLKCFKLWNEYL